MTMTRKQLIALAFVIVLALLAGVGVVWYYGTVVLAGTLLAAILMAAAFALSRGIYQRTPSEQLQRTNDDLKQLIEQRTMELRQSNEKLLATSERWRVTLSSITDG